MTLAASDGADAVVAGVATATTGLAELYRAQYAPMVRLAHLITGSNEVAEDLVQEAFVQIGRASCRERV